MDPSDKANVENLRPKTVPDNLLAWGTISHISDIQIKVQITGGIVCLVDRWSINDTYTKLLREYESNLKKGKNYSEPPKLSQLFKQGQQYVCKITDRKTRKGYTDALDIFATLNPGHLEEDNLPTTLLTIPNVPLQCVVTSIEDHGYQVDIGFKNIIGFLDFDETKHDKNGKKLLVGQVVRCYTKNALSDDSDTRVIQLSMTKEYSKLACFSKDKCGANILTPKCALPGAVGYCTVMKVQKDGLIVNFLDEFAGFVSISHLQEDGVDPKRKYKIADILKCTVLYYNSTTNTFALSLKLKKSFKSSMKSLLKNHYVGQVIPGAEVVRVNGTRYIEFKVGKHRALANVKDAIEQEASTMTKDELLTVLESMYTDGTKYKCRIKSINYADLTIVLSLRKEFLDLPYVSIEELKPADLIKASVKKHVQDGVVVSFGLNLRAIILNMHLRDSAKTKNLHKLDKLYPIGKTISCRVLKVDLDKQPARAYLTDNDQLMQPEMTIVDSYDKSFRGETINAIVCKLKHDGMIVELFNNVKGFIPKRFCSSVPIRAITDLFHVGQTISCTIYRVEPLRQSMLLGIIPYEKIMALKRENKRNRLEKRKLRELNKIDSRIEKKLIKSLKRKKKEEEESSCEDDSDVCSEDVQDEGLTEKNQARKKSRLQRSIEARQREERLREAESSLLDPKRPAQSVTDFERLIIKAPNSADSWVKYSIFFLDNVETEKARMVCRRALKTINFRMEKEKLKVWLQLIKIEAKYGGRERLRQVIEEAAQTNDKLDLYLRAAKVLVTCDELDESERLYEETIKLGRCKPDVWVDYVVFLMEHRKNMDRARALCDKALKSPMSGNDIVYLRSRFAHLEFKYGDVERGKTLFENLLSENPKRKDFWSVYEAAIRKFGTRQLDTEEVREQNELILQRIATLSK